MQKYYNKHYIFKQYNIKNIIKLLTMHFCFKCKKKLAFTYIKAKNFNKN